MRTIALLLVCALALTAAGTRIQDTLNYPDGVKPSGTATITWVAFTAGAVSYAAGEKRVTIRDGVLDVTLEPASYTVHFSLTRGPYVQYWVVPASATPVLLRDIATSTEVAPALTVALSQIDSGGATDGQALVWDAADGRWEPGTITSGSAGAIPIVFLLCAGPCVANETTNWKWTAPFAMTITGCVIDAVTYPTGAALTVDVLKGGATTIFSSTVPTLADGSSTYFEQTGMSAAAVLAKGDYLIAKVLTVGSTVAGQNVNVACTATY